MRFGDYACFVRFVGILEQESWRLEHGMMEEFKDGKGAKMELTMHRKKPQEKTKRTAKESSQSELKRERTERNKLKNALGPRYPACRARGTMLARGGGPRCGNSGPRSLKRILLDRG